MAVTNVTLDSIIKRNLAMSSLPIHYYVPQLVMAKRGLEEMHFDTLQKVKYETLTPTNNEVALPSGFVAEVFVGIEYGDKVRTIGLNPKINNRDNSGNAFDQTADQYSYNYGESFDSVFLSRHFNEYGSFVGGMYGRNVVWTQSYNINRDLEIIRLDNKSEITSVHLVYLSMPEKVSNQSVVHPFAQQALIDYIEWQWAEYNKDQDYQIKRKEFYNQYRILRGRMNKMTTVEVIRALRRNIQLSIKN